MIEEIESRGNYNLNHERDEWMDLGEDLKKNGTTSYAGQMLD